MRSDYLLAYDASCGPCSRFKAVVDFLDVKGRIRFVSLRDADDSGALEDLEPSSRYRSFHLIAPCGAASSGGDALLPLVGLLLPGGGAVSSALGLIPGSRLAIGYGYSVLSRLHGAGGCDTTVK